VPAKPDDPLRTIRIVVEVQTREEDGLIVEVAAAHVEGMGVQCFVEVMATNNTEEAVGEASRLAVLRLRASKRLSEELITYQAFAGKLEQRSYYPLGKAAR